MAETQSVKAAKRTEPALMAEAGDGSPLLKIWDRHRTALTRILAAILFFGGWEWVVRSGNVNPLFISSPTMISLRLFEVFADGSIWTHILASGEIAGLGFIASVAVGVPLGMLMGRVKWVRDVLEPLVIAKYSSPTVAFLPLLIIWFGLGIWSKVVLVFLGGVLVIIINTEAGVANVDPELVETAKSFTANEYQILSKIVIPSAIPFIVTGMRLAVGRILILVVVAELYGSSAGLGYIIFQASAFYDTAMIFVGVIILAAAGIVTNALLRALEMRLTPWTNTLAKW
jgi:ABC-type nitrate/sulfonate/bicarbonate transport system permease component